MLFSTDFILNNIKNSIKLLSRKFVKPIQKHKPSVRYERAEIIKVQMMGKGSNEYNEGPSGIE